MIILIPYILLLSVLNFGCQASSCTNSPTDWADFSGYTCKSYVENEWCTSTGGYGPGWNLKEWGPFNSWANAQGIDAYQACCVCGGGVSATLGATEDAIAYTATFTITLEGILPEIITPSIQTSIRSNIAQQLEVSIPQVSLYISSSSRRILSTGTTLTLAISELDATSSQALTTEVNSAATGNSQLDFFLLLQRSGLTQITASAVTVSLVTITSAIPGPPTQFPTRFPTRQPSPKPVRPPTAPPTKKPTCLPTLQPSKQQLQFQLPNTSKPTSQPTQFPTYTSENNTAIETTRTRLSTTKILIVVFSSVGGIVVLSICLYALIRFISQRNKDTPLLK